MSYKKILVIHPIHDTISALAPALSFARENDAHLDVLVLNLADVPAALMTQNPEYDWGRTFGDLLAQTDRRVQDVTEYLDKADIKHTVRSECAALGLMENLVARSALCTDLVIFTNGQSSFVSGLVGKALEGALLTCGKPVLVLTGNQQTPYSAPESVVIAWDDVPHAAHAVKAAMPILQAAGTVETLVVCENSEVDDVSHNHSTKALAQWLEAHDVSSRLTTVARDGQFISHALANHVEQHPCDLLVMGAYGHSRFSERLFAGTTHVALTDMDVPLLLAHQGLSR